MDSTARDGSSSTELNGPNSGVVGNDLSMVMGFGRNFQTPQETANGDGMIWNGMRDFRDFQAQGGGSANGVSAAEVFFANPRSPPPRRAMSEGGGERTPGRRAMSEGGGVPVDQLDLNQLNMFKEQVVIASRARLMCA